MAGKPTMSENERLFFTIIVIFISFFAINSIISLLFFEMEDIFIMHYKMTVSFVISILIGILVFWITKPKEIFEMDVFGILEKVLNEDETLILKLVRENEGITQDSLRYRCGFSKSKVSVMVQNLERKGIFLREKFGRTYKIHLSESLK